MYTEEEGLTKSETGRRGEELAVKWLRDRGYLIHHLNWRSGVYELDIVAQKGAVLHIIEVKTRKFGSLTTPEEAMTHRKVEAFAKASQLYINLYKPPYDIQFDLIAVDAMQFEEWRVRLIENVLIYR